MSTRVEMLRPLMALYLIEPSEPYISGLSSGKQDLAAAGDNKDEFQSENEHLATHFPKLPSIALVARYFGFRTVAERALSHSVPGINRPQTGRAEEENLSNRVNFGPSRVVRLLCSHPSQGESADRVGLRKRHWTGYRASTDRNLGGQHRKRPLWTASIPLSNRSSRKFK